MDKMKVLIADASDELRLQLTSVLQGSFSVRTTGDGREALQLFRSFQPELLVVDLILPGLDGLTLLQKLAEEGMQTMIMVSSRFDSPYVSDALQRLGVDYVVAKPYEPESIAARLLDMAEQLDRPATPCYDPRAMVANVLLRMGIPTKYRGYAYLRAAVPILASDPAQSITKELYPAVAEECGGSANQVERCIRGAINFAWSRRSDSIWRLYFQPDGVSGEIPRPSNATFISRLAEALLLSGEKNMDAK